MPNVMMSVIGAEDKKTGFLSSAHKETMNTASTRPGHSKNF